MIDVILKPIRLLLGLRLFKTKSGGAVLSTEEIVTVENKNEEVFSVEDIYTPLSVAKEEIWRRWNDKELRKKVEDFLGGELPEVLRKSPAAVLSRGILTPNLETKHFLDAAEIIGLNPACAEFGKDKFCSNNEDKIHLGKMVFFHKFNKNGDKIITRQSVIDFRTNENKSFNEITTRWGENFMDFHHRMFKSFFGKDVDIFDISIYKMNEESAKEVYRKLFSLFVCNGVMMENFIAKDNHYEKKFTNEVVVPAFREISEFFGVKPMIIPIMSIADEDKNDWMYYPGTLEFEVKESIKF